MFRQLRPALVSLLVLTVITGVLYPLAITGLAAVIFPYQSTGSVLAGRNGKPMGSELIGQPFDDPAYFWPRPSATSPVPYVAYNREKGTSSTGSNLAASNPDLLKAVQDRIAALKSADPGNTQPVPVDLVTASASGLDPHISPAAAEYQLPRIARLRHMPENDLRKLVIQCTENRQFGFLGEARVNVLKLNLALDAALPVEHP